MINYDMKRPIYFFNTPQHYINNGKIVYLPSIWLLIKRIKRF